MSGEEKQEMTKEKKLPIRKDIPVNIPNAKIVTNFKSKPITYIRETATNISALPNFITPEIVNELDKIHDIISRTPAFFTPEERANDEIRQLRVLARGLFNTPFSAGSAYRIFGTAKLPKKVTIECHLCGQTIQYVVDFFTHGVLDHGNSLQNIESVFQKVLDKIQYL